VSTKFYYPTLILEQGAAQVVKGQVTRDKAVLDLVAIMASIYSFVDAIEAVPDKVQILEETIKRIFIQTVECAIFIQEYACKGFGGRSPDDFYSHQAHSCPP
jgi:hypothetical protein